MPKGCQAKVATFGRRQAAADATKALLAPGVPPVALLDDAHSRDCVQILRHERGDPEIRDQVVWNGLSRVPLGRPAKLEVATPANRGDEGENERGTSILVAFVLLRRPSPHPRVRTYPVPRATNLEVSDSIAGDLALVAREAWLPATPRDDQNRDRHDRCDEDDGEVRRETIGVRRAESRGGRATCGRANAIRRPPRGLR